MVRDPRATYRQSLQVLQHAKLYRPSLVTKTSLMLGLGETDDQILRVMEGGSDGPIVGEIQSKRDTLYGRWSENYCKHHVTRIDV